jgi:peptidoglycan/LPS O-acetylase OafA/YrhL
MSAIPIASMPVTRSSEAEPLRLGYRPALDGLRAFAVLAVMAHHALLPYFSGGSIGVDIFFVLSGFLITSLLLEEWRKTGAISLRKFYLRRVLRLIPALTLFLIFIQSYVLAMLRGPKFWEMEKAIASVVFYIGNWVQAFHLVNMSILSHAWSLSIEEQFYLVWPFVLLVLLRRGWRERWILSLLGFAIGFIVLMRALMWSGSDSISRIYFGSDTRSDELLVGCALAMWIRLNIFPRERVRSILQYFLFPASLLILAMIMHPWRTKIMYTIGWPTLELAVSIVILSLMLEAAGPLQRVFELRPVVWIGKLSYGLYLWHFPIIGRTAEWQIPGPFKWIAGFALSFVAASASYYLVEVKFLRRKQRFEAA